MQLAGVTSLVGLSDWDRVLLNIFRVLVYYVGVCAGDRGDADGQS